MVHFFYQLNRLIGLVGRVFVNGLGDLGSILSRVIPRTLKIVLDTSLLNTQHCKVRIKGKGDPSNTCGTRHKATGLASASKQKPTVFSRSRTQLIDFFKIPQILRALPVRDVTRTLWPRFSFGLL